MAQPFVLDVNLRIQQVLGLDKAKQQLASIQIGGVSEINKLSTGLKSVGVNAASTAVQVTKGAKATTRLGDSARKTGKELGRAAKKAETFGDQTLLAGKRYAAFLGATVVAFKAFQLISVGTKSVIEFDKSMVSLSQIIGTSVDDLRDLSQQFLDLSVATGTSAAEIANAAKLLAQAGFRGAELTEAVEQLAKVPLTPIFENMDQAVDGAIAAMRQFSSEGLTVETVFDKMIKVSNNYAASFPDIIEGLKRGGSAFQAIGGTLDEFIAAFTTIRSVTRESASAVGTSLKTLSSRLADPKIIKFLETKDIRLIEEGQFVGPLEAIRRIGEGLAKTNTIQDRINIATKLGGRRQISRFLAVAQNAEKTSEILGVSQNSFGEFDRVATKGLQSVAVQIDILVAKGKKLAIDLGEDLFIPFIRGLTGAADSAIALLDALKPILPLVAKIGAIFAGGAIVRGLGAFIGPKLGKLAGPAAFAAAGGGLKGAGAGIGASPFIQAGLLIAASEAASALLKTADGAESFTGTLITSIAAISAGIALFRSQTIAQFAAGGGLFSSFGKLGKLGGLAGSLATAGAIAIPLAIADANRTAAELSDKIVKSAVESISEIRIDPADPKSLTQGLDKLYQKIAESTQELIDSADPQQNPSLAKSFAGIGRAFNNLLEGDYEGLLRRGGLSQKDIGSHIQELLKKSPELIDSLVESIASSLVIDGKVDQTPHIARRRLVETGVEGGLDFSASNQFASAIINSVGGLDIWSNRVQKSADFLQEETKKREKVIKLIKNFIPTKLVGQLVQFSKAVDQTARTISLSAKLFETQIAEIAGGIQAPSFNFDFGTKQVESLIRGGGLKELFAFAPDIPRFVGAFTEIEELLDSFIINISNLPTTDLNIAGEVNKFFESQKDVPQVVKDNFENFFNTIAADISKSAEGKLIDPEEIKKRFLKEFEGIGAGTTDAVVESITSFMNSTFAQIEDELNRLATVRQFELEAAVRPETQAAFLEQQLRRVGISAGGGREANQVRGSLEELDLIRREREARGGRGAVPGLLPTPGAGFFEGRDQRLVDITGDERIRQQVRDSFRAVITESSALKKKLAELQPGTEGFLSASRRAKELSRSTIELQTTMEALDRATQQALDSEKRTLALRQQFETAQAQARVAERVRTGALQPLQGERILFNLAQEQAKEQIALQDRFDTIIEKDNLLRVDLARQISESTQTQAEIIGEFSTSANIFADATKIQATTTDLMRQSISLFGQAVVDFSNLKNIGQDISLGGADNITPAQIRSGGTTIQQAYDELNRVINEGNTSQKDMLEILKAIHDRQEQIQPVKQEPTAAQKEQERDTEITEKISQLTESLDGLRVVLNEPNELRIISDQRVEIDLSTLPSDVINEVRPALEEAGLIIAKTVTRKALESLAAKSDSELSIAAIDVAQELT